MKTKEEILKEKEDLLKQLDAEEIETSEYHEKKEELDDQLKLIKDNDSIGRNIKIIKICVIIIAAIMSLYTVFVAVTWISSMAMSGGSYEEWGDDDIDYSEDAEDLEGVEF